MCVRDGANPAIIQLAVFYWFLFLLRKTKTFIIIIILIKCELQVVLKTKQSIILVSHLILSQGEADIHTCPYSVLCIGKLLESGLGCIREMQSIAINSKHIISSTWTLIALLLHKDKIDGSKFDAVYFSISTVFWVCDSVSQGRGTRSRQTH